MASTLQSHNLGRSKISLEPGFVVYGDGDLVIEQHGAALRWTRSRRTTGSDGGCFRCRALSPARPTRPFFPAPQDETRPRDDRTQSDGTVISVAEGRRIVADARAGG